VTATRLDKVFPKDIFMTRPFFHPLPLAFAAFAIPAAALAEPSCARYFWGSDTVQDIIYCASSSLPASSVAAYGPGNANAYDADYENLAWCEGAKGNGAGEWLELHVTGAKARFDTIEFENGYQKSLAAYRNNARLRTIEIETGTGFRAGFRLQDIPGYQSIKLPEPMESTYIRMTIVDVYPGEKYSDTCLTSMSVSF
jgi:hypothetical protein